MATYNGTTNNDTLSGSANGDSMYGYAGDDVILGQNGSDYLDGGDDNDQLYGSLGDDTLSGGAGNDNLYGDIGNDSLIGGDGQDSAWFDLAPSAVNVNLTTGVASGGDGNDVLASIEGVVGSAYNDTITGSTAGDDLLGNTGDDLISGLDGADYIQGDGGNDTLFGGAGGDLLFGGAGNDSMDGGAGSDTGYYAFNRSTYTIGAFGTGLVVTGASEGSDTLTGVEHLSFLDGEYAVTNQGIGQQAVQLVTALFGAAALSDKVLFGTYFTMLEGGATLEEVMGAAVNSDRFAQTAGSHSNTAFVNTVYHNVTGTSPDPAFLANFVGLLNNGGYTQASLGVFALGFIAPTTSTDLAFTPLAVGNITGTDTGEALTGTAVADFLLGRGGNDTITGGEGSDTIDGGTGIDRAVYAGVKSAFAITHTDAGLTVSQTGTADVDHLFATERVSFTDIAVAFDISGNAGIAAKLVTAIFGAAALPEEALVGQYLAMLDSGMSETAVAAAAAASARFAADAGGHSNAQFVDRMIFNVLGFHPDAPTAQYYIDLLGNGFTQGDLAALATETSYNIAHVDLVGLTQTGLEYTVS